MPIPLALIAGAGALLQGIGNYKKGKAQQKQGAEAAKLAHEAATRDWDQREATRIALLKSLQSRAGTSGPKVTALLQGLDPSMFQARPYAGPQPAQETGTSTLGSILSGVGGAVSSYADFQTQKSAEAQRDAQQQKLLCAIVPTLPDCMPLDGNIPAGSVGGAIEAQGGLSG